MIYIIVLLLIFLVTFSIVEIYRRSRKDDVVVDPDGKQPSENNDKIK